MTSNKWKHSAHPLTCALLEANHVNPATVSTDRISAGGYFAFTLGNRNQRQLDGEDYKKTWHEWSRPELGEQVVEAMRKDRS